MLETILASLVLNCGIGMNIQPRYGVGNCTASNLNLVEKGLEISGEKMSYVSNNNMVDFNYFVNVEDDYFNFSFENNTSGYHALSTRIGKTLFIDANFESIDVSTTQILQDTFKYRAVGSMSIGNINLGMKASKDVFKGLSIFGEGSVGLNHCFDYAANVYVTDVKDSFSSSIKSDFVNPINKSFNTKLLIGADYKLEGEGYILHVYANAGMRSYQTKYAKYRLNFSPFLVSNTFDAGIELGKVNGFNAYVHYHHECAHPETPWSSEKNCGINYSTNSINIGVMFRATAF